MAVNPCHFGLCPICMLSGAYQVRNIKGRTVINKKLLENAGQVFNFCTCSFFVVIVSLQLASQAIENIRTVHSLGVETSFSLQYNLTLKEPFKQVIY